MFLKPSASCSAPLPSWCIEYYRWKATVQVSLVSIVSLGPQRALPVSLLSAKLGSTAGQMFWTCWMPGPSLAEVYIFFFFFCIEIYRSPLHHVPCLLSLWVWGRLERCRCGSAPRAPAKPAQEQAAAPRAPHILLLLCNYGYGKLASVILSPHLSLLWRAQEHRKKKSPVLIWCSKDLLEVNPNSSVNLLSLSNSLHNIAGIREFYDFLKTLHKYRQYNFI